MDLFGSELIAIDGSKFSAVNHNSRNYTKDKLKNLLKQINEQIENYLTELDQGDDAESEIKEFDSHQLQAKIDQLRQDKTKLEQMQEQLQTSGKSQASLTDPDSRMMKSNKGSDISYNVQIVTDFKELMANLLALKANFFKNSILIFKPKYILSINLMHVNKLGQLKGIYS
jgi:hypothetical protein